MKQEPKKIDDDGRVICNMDVEGMRPRSMQWLDKHIHREKSTARPVSQGEQLTRSETWRYAWSAVLSGLLIVLVFSVGWVLFILFCTEVWFS